MGAGEYGGGRGPAWWQPWISLAFFAFLLHFVWEMLQVPFFEEMPDAAHWQATLACLRATGGDVTITLAAYGMVAGLVRNRSWVRWPTGLQLLAFVAFGMGMTTVLELLATQRWDRWSYSAEMPEIAGVGLVPLLQWMLLPPLALWLTRRHLE